MKVILGIHVVHDGKHTSKAQKFENCGVSWITVKPVLSDHIKQHIFGFSDRWLLDCCMKVVQKHELSVLLSFSSKQPPFYSDF